MNNMFLSNYVASKWAAEPLWLESFIAQISELKVTESLADIEVAVKPRSYNIIGGRAVINISGVLLKSVPGWLRFWGIEATGYDEIQAQIGQAMADSSIQGIHLQVSSPGGIIDGLADTADAIFAARAGKKVTATIEDLGASAAYWLASQAETIEANRTTEVGSIGVYTVYLDSSKAAEDEGFKVVLIRSGEHKGMGVPGVEITDDQIAAVQANIDAIADQFVESVARGRSTDAGDIKKLATGRLWIAADAKKLGLIDRVTNTNQKSNSKVNSKKGETKMDNENTVSLAENEKAVADSAAASAAAENTRMKAMSEAFADDPEFAIKSFTAGKTVEQAKADYCDVLREKLAKKQEEKTATTAAAGGAEPLATGDTDDEAGGDFMAQAREMAAEKKITLTAAMKKLNRQKPALHAAFVNRPKEAALEAYRDAG